MYVKNGELHLVWCVYDVKEYALHNMKEKIELTDEQCVDVLNIMLKKHDCEYGTTWISVECAIDELING